MFVFAILLFSYFLPKKLYEDGSDDPTERCVHYDRESERKAIRIHFDTSSLNSNSNEKNISDQYQCTKTGEIIDLLNYSDFQPLEQYNCTEKDILNEENIEIFEETLQNVAHYLAKLLKVNRIVGNLTIEQQHETDPEPEFNTFETDLYVQVVSRPDRENTGQSFIRACVGQLRATQALIIIRPDEIKKAKFAQNETNRTNRELFTTILHELFHILGLKKALMDYWIIPGTNKTYSEEGEDVIQQFNHPDFQNKTLFLLTTPNAHKFAKDRFNTTHYSNNESISLGIELEDGDEGDHPETRVYFNDIMNPITSGDLRISDVTIAMLKDTNYYDVNADMAESLSWGDAASLGKEKDPEFAYGSPQDAFPRHYICTQEEINNTINGDDSFFVCSHDYQSISTCKIDPEIYSCDNTDNEVLQYYCQSKDFYNPKDITHFPLDRYDDFTPFKQYNSSCLAQGQKCGRVKQDDKDIFNAQCINAKCSDDGKSYTIHLVDDLEGVCSNENETIKIGNYSVKCENPQYYCAIDKYEKEFKSFFSSSTSSPTNDDDDLSTIAIVFICIGSVTVGGATITVTGVVIVKKKSKSKKAESPEAETPSNEIHLI